MSVQIRRTTAGFVERQAGRMIRHMLSFGERYDPDNLRFGPMVCHDDHLLGNGQGFEAHRHSDVVIVTWVISGALTHTDPSGATTVFPGEVAVLHAGSGVEHSEVASAPQTRFVQVWLAAPEAAEPSDPRYAATAPALVPGEVSVVTEPLPGAVLSVARLQAGQDLEVPAGPQTHVYVGRGALLRSSLAEPLQEGDAFRFVDEPAHRVTAAVPSELLVWSFAEPAPAR